MARRLFTSESVTEGHPDKVCDCVSDAVLDSILAQDKNAHVACETAATTGLVHIMGEISANADVDIEAVARKVIKDIGYDNPEVGFDGNTCKVIVSLDKQSPDIAMGVNESFEHKDGETDEDNLIGAGDGGSGATEEMVELMHRFEKLSVMPETEHMTGKEFLHGNFDGNEKLSVWDGELYLEMHRGTFTTKSNLKAFNRRLEFMLREAELLSVLRMKQGAYYPAEKIREIYKKLMINQFHDILPGSHITPVYRDAVADYEQVHRLLGLRFFFGMLSHRRGTGGKQGDQKCGADAKHKEFLHLHPPLWLL